MSVINKMLQDLDKRGAAQAAQGRAEDSLRGTGIPLETGASRGRWKIAAWALIVPLVLAAGWIVLRPGSGPSDGPAKTPPSVSLAAVAPQPAQVQAKADVLAPAPLPPQQTPEPSPKPQAPAATVIAPAPVAPVAKPEVPMPSPQAPAAVAVAPVIPVAKPPAPTPAPLPQAPVVAAVPTAPAVKPPAPAPAPPPKAPVIAAAPSALPAKPQSSAPATQAKVPAVAAVPAAPVVKPPAQAPSPPQVPAPAAAPPKAPMVVAQAKVTPEPASKSEAPARELKPERKPPEGTDSAISISKKPLAATRVAEPKKAAPKTPVAAADAKPSAPAPATDAGRPAAPAQDAAKSSISVERQDPNASRRERVSTEYRNAVDLMNQGRAEPAIDTYAGVLRLDPKHAAARQALVALLMGRGRGAEAQGFLREGLTVLPENTAWAMLLARLQVESGDKAGALATLDGVLPYAKNRPDYHAFVGTVLQLQGRHKEAIAYYEIAVRLSPDSGRWLTGLAISLEEEKRLPEAREAYQRALGTTTLAPDLRAFVERKLGQLK